MKRIIRLLKLNKLDDKGSTILETVIAFVVLTIVLLSLFRMVTFSSQLRMRAIDTANVRNSFNQNYYMTDVDRDDSESVYNIKHYDYEGISNKDQYTAFMLVFDGVTTDETNYQFGANEIDMSKPLTLSRIDATGYVSCDPMTDNNGESIVTPKLLKFRYYDGPFVKKETAGDD